MGTMRAWEAAYAPFAPIRLDDGEPSSDGLRRSWVMLMPEGEFSHPDYGKLHFDRKKLGTFKAHFDDRVRKIDIAFDLDHDAKAATGWLERICFGEEIGREPGLWGLTAWTPLGIQKLQDRIYRYFSPEFGDYTDEESGQVYHDVIIGGALTNRPFLKVMPAVALSEVSTRQWSSVDKTKLPNSCFLDSANRRLPVYEGAGTVGKNGRYSQRGKLNINGLRAAKAALHGARTGTPMSGLPAGVAARIERLLARYEATQARAASTASEHHVGEVGGTMGRTTTRSTSTLEIDDENRRIFMGGKATPKPAQDDADGDQQMYDDGDSDAESYDDDDADSAAMDDDGTDDSAAMDDDESMDDGDGPDDTTMSKKAASKKGASKKASRGSKKASESYDAGESDTVTLREQRLAAQLSEVRARMVEMERREYASQVKAILSGWDAGQYQFSESSIKNPDAGTTRHATARVALSRPAREAISKFLLSERAFRMSEESRDEICRLFELAAKGAVDLSARGSSFDQEERKTIRLGGQRPDANAQEQALEEQVEAIALSEYRKPVNKLTHHELAEAQQKAAALVGYR